MFRYSVFRKLHQLLHSDVYGLNHVLVEEPQPQPAQKKEKYTAPNENCIDNNKLR